ncbi:2'-5' RNA ligase family protein [Acetobacter orientalis]|uniref:2'-5' RNA ligase family protein n=1 Tax=Acetobacter orientalis TaxID=146474 RepID=UPI0039E93D88
MNLVVGITPSESLRMALLDLQSQFWTSDWAPYSYLMLPLCSLGEVTHPLVLEELDHALMALRTPHPITLEPVGFDVFTRRDRITLELKFQAPALDHLSVKIGTIAKRAGVKKPQVRAPLTLPLATITTVAPDDASAWLQLHPATAFEPEVISEITLFRTWKNSETTFFIPETDYLLTEYSLPIS